MAGLYVHIPFCESRCYYCDFYSSTFKGNREALLSAIQKELMDRKAYLKNEPVRTLYFGGGTPSQLTIEELDKLLQTIFRQYDCQIEELTLEANPEDLSKDYLTALKQLGVNRLSIGIQSFDDADLKRMNRRHTAQTAIDMVQLAQQVGFDNISIDLIYGLPDQTLEGWERNLQQAITLNVQHISAYSLTFEEGSLLTKMKARGEVKEVDEEVSLKMFQTLRKVLSAAGYLPYEISNFSRVGYESKHNSSYWNYVPYLGVGPSAHSFDGTTRRWNVANSRLYIQSLQEGNPYYEMETLDESTRYNEYVMTSLRKSVGIRKEMVRDLFGDSYYAYFRKMTEPFLSDGNLRENQDNIYLSENGIFISDYIIESLLWVE